MGKFLNFFSSDFCCGIYVGVGYLGIVLKFGTHDGMQMILATFGLVGGLAIYYINKDKRSQESVTEA